MKEVLNSDLIDVINVIKVCFLWNYSGLVRAIFEGACKQIQALPGFN
jgi:hypothetical protein